MSYQYHLLEDIIYEPIKSKLKIISTFQVKLNTIYLIILSQDGLSS